MASKYWIKLYHEILDDPKMGKLSDRLWRRAVELFLLAGDMDAEGYLPPPEDMAWRLRIPEEELIQDLEALSKNDVAIVEHWKSGWYVTKFEDRQGPISSEERSRQFRDRERKENYYQTQNERNTNESFGDSDSPTNTDINSEAERKPNESFVDTDTDTDTESDTDKKQTTTTAVAAAVKKLLIDFGVEEPWLSDLAMMCSEKTVKDWIAYVNGRDGVKNPTGFLISRLRVGESPPIEEKKTWFTGDDFKQFFVQPGELPEEE